VARGIYILKKKNVKRTTVVTNITLKKKQKRNNVPKYNIVYCHCYCYYVAVLEAYTKLMVIILIIIIISSNTLIRFSRYTTNAFKDFKRVLNSYYLQPTYKLIYLHIIENIKYYYTCHCNIRTSHDLLESLGRNRY